MNADRARCGPGLLLAKVCKGALSTGCPMDVFPAKAPAIIENVCVHTTVGTRGHGEPVRLECPTHALPLTRSSRQAHD